MSKAEFDSGSGTSVPIRRWDRGRLLIVGVSATMASGVGYMVAFALGCSTSCATGRSPITFALLLGLTAAFAAASGMPSRR